MTTIFSLSIFYYILHNIYSYQAPKRKLDMGMNVSRTELEMGCIGKQTNPNNPYYQKYLVDDAKPHTNT